MGCIASRTANDERVSICKDRKKLMKQLLVYRKEFGDAQLGYLRALKNTGVTLRQFTESDSLEPDEIPFRHELPPSPPPPLPPSPPPPFPPSPPPPSSPSPPPSLPPSPPLPPTFSPDLRIFEDNHSQGLPNERVIEIDGESVYAPQPPPAPGSIWEFWDSLGSSSEQHGVMSETGEKDDEDYFAETNSEFMEDDDEGESDTIDYYFVNGVPVHIQPAELSDETSSMTSSHTKDTADMPMIVCGSKKILAGIVRELDDYFLEASSCVKDVAVLMDNNMCEAFPYRFKETKSKRYNSRKVFSALTWSWSSRSLQSSRDFREQSVPVQPCKPGAHFLTLDNIYAEEQKLYKLMKKEEITKVEHAKKSHLLQKQEASQDWTKIDKTRSIVESLRSDILSLKQSISRTSSTILNLTNDELKPQLIALTSGLMHMWQIMYECHQVQNHICKQLAYITDLQHVDSTTEYKRRAADQLKTEVTSWYDNFCRLVIAQRDYVQAICRWSQLADCLVDEDHRSTGPSSVHALSKEWLHALDKLQDKMASEAIKSLLSAIREIVQQQDQEVHQRKRLIKLEKKLQKESKSLAGMEMKISRRITTEDFHTVLSSKHPLSIKRHKVKDLKKQVSDEKAKYINSVSITKAMILNNLQTGLPHVFRPLMAFSSSYSQAIQAVLSRATRIGPAVGSLTQLS